MTRPIRDIEDELDVESFRSELSVLQKKIELIEDNKILKDSLTTLE